MSYLCHGKERGDACRIIKVGKNLLRNEGGKGTAPSTPINTHTTLLTIYFLSNKGKGDDNWDSKNIRLDS